MKIKHTFKSSRDNNGYGYYAYINEKNQLIIGENWPHEGGDLFTGTYEGATGLLKNLKDKAPRMYNDIVKYYTQNCGEVNKVTLAALEYGNKFIRVNSEDQNEYMLVDMEVSKCFVYGEKLSGFVTALCLGNYKIYLFDKSTEVKLI